MTKDVAPLREPILRLMPRPHDINTNGHIFGGWVLSQMDIAGGIIAHRLARGPVATVAIDSMVFLQPVLLHDVISVYGEVARIGRTSCAIRLEIIASRPEGDVRVTEGLFTFVALDENHRPRPIPRD